ncbi:hypothetical protein D3C75_1362490 [compost metagenome]
MICAERYVLQIVGLYVVDKGLQAILKACIPKAMRWHQLLIHYAVMCVKPLF